MSISEVIVEGLPRFVAADCRDDCDAGEDALSLCYLPLYGDADDYSFSSADASSSFGDDFFEFWGHTDDFNHPGPSQVWNSRKIVFCGKLIPALPTSNPSSVSDWSDQTAKWNMTSVAKKAKAEAMNCSSARCDKWYMMAFGLARFPSEMVLSEIRRRQGKIVVSERRRGKKDLGSSRRDADAVVKASSFGCFPRM